MGRCAETMILRVSSRVVFCNQIWLPRWRTTIQPADAMPELPRGNPGWELSSYGDLDDLSVRYEPLIILHRFKIESDRLLDIGERFLARVSFGNASGKRGNNDGVSPLVARLKNNAKFHDSSWFSDHHSDRSCSLLNTLSTVSCFAARWLLKTAPRGVLPVEHVQDHEEDELLGELIGVVVVRTVREGGLIRRRMFFRVESTLGVPLASLGSRAAGVPSSLRSDRSAPLRPLTHTPSAANNRTTALACLKVAVAFQNTPDCALPASGYQHHRTIGRASLIRT